ncbi:DUF2500 domain-containing protein [Clostridium tagluense]|uniref:DUF2500 domain-containing protein n=1 Tax=Clostridium tagluense TaxID=360422 RepID=A0A401UKZ6_9CLOT|nr:hypothetical protein Ctaglu_17980 [Clostridium tagluense]
MFMFNIIQFMVPVIFMIIFGIIIFGIIKGTGQWSKNNKQPVLSVKAKVVTKRAHTTSSSMNDNQPAHSSTFYNVTFEVESGDRMELKISGGEYGLLAEGDVGKLTFQGTRYKNFERQF